MDGKNCREPVVVWLPYHGTLLILTPCWGTLGLSGFPNLEEQQLSGLTWFCSMALGVIPQSCQFSSVLCSG